MTAEKAWQRFRAKGLCQNCGRPHLVTVRCLPDGRWFDEKDVKWRSGRGDLFLGSYEKALLLGMAKL